MTFEANSLSVEVELAEDKIVGQLVPPASGTVTVMTLDGVAGQAQTDTVGRFVLPRPSPRPVRFCCQAQVNLITDWVRV
jgi:hypothetical protein